MTQPTNEQLYQLRTETISNGVGSTTTNFIASARGAMMWDVEGREYIDFAGGIGVMNIGHCHPKVVAAINEQAEKLTHSCFMVNPYESAVNLARKLCQVTPGDFSKKAVFLNCGAEAVENAVKIARYYTKRPAIIVFETWQQQFDIIGGIRGLGAMLGLELVKGANREPAADEAKQLAGFCLEKGLMVLACGSYGNIIRVLAPFVITDEQLGKGLGIMEEGLVALT